MALSLSSGKEIGLSSSKFLHFFINFKGQSKEIRHFQNGEAFSSQRTAAQTTLSTDFHGNADYFESEDASGSFTVNTTPTSETTNILGWLYHYQHDTITPIKTMDAYFGITVSNDLTGQNIVAEGCRISGLPADQGSETAYALAWNILCADYDDSWDDPQDALFSTAES